MYVKHGRTFADTRHQAVEKKNSFVLSNNGIRKSLMVLINTKMTTQKNCIQDFFSRM